ncbi:MAG: NADH-quinone oxidoreductase subunit N, partial [Rhizobiales bacterium]|nr:NADH-quinone oxidoreductase subunit N [Hyphomicrobiales bacterium]
MMDLATFPSLMPFLPELVLAGGALVLLMIGAFGGERTTSLVTTLAMLLVLVAALVLIFKAEDGVTFNGAFVLDPFARFMKLLALIGSGFAILLSTGYTKQEKIARFEYPVLILLATLGMMLMISANDLIALYLGLELQSLALYVVAASNRESVKSTEAGLKYFV